MARQISLNIKDGVAIPSRETLLDRIPWDRIKVGSSFPVTDDLGDRPVERLRTAISYRQKMTTERYTVRHTNDGYRCWRIA